MQILLDNDAVFKLARYSLLTEFDRLARSNACRPPHRCLASAVSIFRREYPQDEALGDVISLAGSCGSIGPVINEGVIKRLSLPGIDPGEQALFEHAIGDVETLIVTGDKRCIRALAGRGDLADLHTILSGRIVQFDRVVLGLCERFGTRPIRSKISSKTDVDIGVERDFKSVYNDAQAIANLRVRIGQLEAEAQGMLHTTF